MSCDSLSKGRTAIVSADASGRVMRARRDPILREPESKGCIRPDREGRADSSRSKPLWEDQAGTLSTVETHRRPADQDTKNRGRCPDERNGGLDSAPPAVRRRRKPC